MTFREHIELQEKLQNGTKESAIMHRMETNSWNQLVHNRR